MSEVFTTAHADTMRTVLDYVEDRYFSSHTFASMSFVCGDMYMSSIRAVV